MAQWLPLGTVAGIAAPATASVAYAPVTPMKAAPAFTPLVFPTAPPLAMSIAPSPARSGGERWLLRLAVTAGLLLTLQRNDVLFSVSRASKQQAYYTQLERRYLSGPQFGTARSVEQLVSASGGALPRVRLPWLVEEATHNAAAAQLTSALPPAAHGAQAAQSPAASSERTALAPSAQADPNATAPASKVPPPLSVASANSSRISTATSLW